MNRTISAAMAAAALAGCAGRITARDMAALGHYRDRQVVLSPAGDGRLGELAASARRGAEGPLAAVTGTAPAGGASWDAPAPAPAQAATAKPPLTIDVYPILPGEGHGETLTAVGVVSEVGKAAGGRVQQATGVAATIVGAGTLLYDATQVRVALVLRAPERKEPLGGVVWEGFRGASAAKTAEEAGRVAGEALARDIEEARDQWVTRRPGDERLILTPTPLLLAPGEKVVSNDMVLVFHAGVGVKRWLQLDASLGALPVPMAGGIIYAGEGGAAGIGGAGAAIVGVATLGVKVRVLEEGPSWPGLSLGYDMVDIWGGALGGGGLFVLGKGLAYADGAAGAGGANLQFNLFTVAASKHPREWLAVGAGAYVIDHHAWMPEGSALVVATRDGVTGAVAEADAKFATTTLPFVSVEAAVGSHFRFISEYVAAPGADYLSLGVRTILYGSGRIAGLRKPGLRFRLDVATLVSEGTHGGLEAVPWIGAGMYL
jgi:hypothetical protein